MARATFRTQFNSTCPYLLGYLRLVTAIVARATLRPRDRKSRQALKTGSIDRVIWLIDQRFLPVLTVIYDRTEKAIWKIPIDGGEPVQIVAAPSHWPDISPDGKSVGCWYKLDVAAPWMVAIFSIDGGPPIKILDVAPESPIKWTPEGDAISYVKTKDAVSNIWSQQINGATPKQLTHFTSEQITNLDWSSDRRLIFSRGAKERDVVLIRNFR